MLRLEVSLFSGFELASITQIVVTPTENMAEMQHGYFANNLWFVFANISTTCPICVQYIVRSSFIVSSLRPAFARIYPASREDLAAETFFHTHGTSNLLKSITEDDLITWFGKNTSRPVEYNMESPECKKNGSNQSEKQVRVTTDIPRFTTPLQVNTNTPNPLQKFENLSITTYTINVDNNSISNLTEKNDESELIVPTAIAIKEDVTTSEITGNSETENTTTKSIDSIIIQAKTGDGIEKKIEYNNDEDNDIEIQRITSTGNLLSNDLKNIELVKKVKRNPDNEENLKIIPEISTGNTTSTPNVTTEEIASLEKPGKHNNSNQHFAVNVNQTTELKDATSTPSHNILSSTPSPSSPLFSQQTAQSNQFTQTPPKELIVDRNVSPPRHINTEKHELPLKYLPSQKDDDELPVTFAPEMKNDRYLLLDKEELWGMLREAVSDEINKKKQDRVTDHDNQHLQNT